MELTFQQNLTVFLWNVHWKPCRDTRLPLTEKSLYNNMEDKNRSKALVSNVFKMRPSSNQQIDPIMYNLLRTYRSLKPSKNWWLQDIAGACTDTLKTYDSSIWVFDDEAVCFISLWLDDSSSALALKAEAHIAFPPLSFLKGHWRSFSPHNFPKRSPVDCPCWHKSLWNPAAGGRPVSRPPARQSSRLWLAWCCTPNCSPLAPQNQTGSDWQR